MVCMFCQRISIIYSSRILWLNTPNESWIPVKSSPSEFTLQRVFIFSWDIFKKMPLMNVTQRVRSQIKKSRLPVNPLFQARLPIPPLKLLFQALLPLIQICVSLICFFFAGFSSVSSFAFLQTKTNIQERGVKENEMIQCSILLRSKFVSVSSVVVFKRR